MKTAKQIRRFVELELLDHPMREDPIAAGMLDSLAIEQLAAFLEEKYELVLEDEDFVAENFTSIDAVAALVDAKLAKANAKASR